MYAQQVSADEWTQRLPVDTGFDFGLFWFGVVLRKNQVVPTSADLAVGLRSAFHRNDGVPMPKTHPLPSIVLAGSFVQINPRSNDGPAA